MSFFDTANADGYRGSAEEGSAGPRLGFQEAFSAAWDATTKAHSLLAVEQGLRAVEQNQIKRIREAGLRPPESLDEGESSPFLTQFRQGRYSAAAQSIKDGGGWYTDELIARRDEHIRQLQKDRPDLGLLTYGDMFKQVQADAQEAEKRSELPKTFAGHVGAFFGEAAGSLDPVSNPVNFATLGVGGGEGVIGRAAVQGLGQMATESVALAASDPENILLQRQRQPGEDVRRLGMAAAGGVLADLGFQGVGAVGRRLTTGKWFADRPLPPEPKPAVEAPPAPFQGEVPPSMPAGRPLHEYPDFETFARAHGQEPMPYGFTPEAKRRTALDLDHVTAELQRWDGPAPWELKPPETMTALPRAPEPGVEINIAPGSYTRYLNGLETIDDIARRIDPDLFRQYDQLQRNIEEIRAGIEREKNATTFFDADEAARKQRELNARQWIQKFDQQMRDLAPLVTRAYGAAEREWRSAPVDHNALNFFKSIEESGARWRYRGEGEKSLTEQPIRPRTEEPAAAPASTDDKIPAASMEPDIDKRLRVDTDTAVARARQNTEHVREKLDEKVEAFVTNTQKMAKLDAKQLEATIAAATKALAEAKIAMRDIAARGDKKAAQERVSKAEQELDELTNVTFPDGRKLSLDKDFAPFVHDDGTVENMTIRDYLREMAKDQDALQSVTTCSRPS